MENKQNQPLGWNLPSPVQPGYPSQSHSPLQPGYVQQSNVPIAHYQHGVPVVSVHGHMPVNSNTNEDSEAAKNVLPDNFGASFSSVTIRHLFIRKVYSIVFMQLLVTLGFVALFTLHDDVKHFVQRHYWVYILSYVTFLVTYITLICCKGVRRKWPGNVIMLSLFTLSMSYILGAISAFYKTEIVLLAIGMTTIICFLITLFATQTKIDFTGYGVYLFVASMVLVVFGILAIILSTVTDTKIMSLIYSAGIVLLFSMYLIFDTQRMVGGKKHELSAEEHIYGALVLYIDVVMIFLGILGLSRYN